MAGDRYEFVVVGSGAGGATIAKELSERGREVLVLERGAHEERVGTFRDARRYYDASRVLKRPRRSTEGVVLWRTFMGGGSTMVSCGNGVRVLESELAAMGIDVTETLNEVEAELGVVAMDESLLSEGTKRVRDAASDLGYTFRPMRKFLDLDACRRCAHCTLGCPAGAKWTASEFLAVAEEQGAEIRYETEVTAIDVVDGRLDGVTAAGPDGTHRIDAEVVILAAGALGTPVLLQRAGIDAGDGLFVDLFVNVYGVTPDVGQLQEPQMSLLNDEFHESEGFILSPYVNVPREVRFIEAGMGGAVLPIPRTVGLMVKTRDDAAGRVHPNGTVSKPVTEADQARLDAGVDRAREILVAAGATADSILVTKPQGAHPGGTAGIGRVVDATLETSVEGLYVCDASVLPETPGAPPILTIVALAKRLGATLDERRPR
jgi:choline dehydrogenase-like flavoprotein